MSQPYEGDSSTQNIAGIIGRNTAGGDGVFGSGTSGGRGVVGVSDSHTGVEGNSNSGVALFGSSSTGEGVHGVSHSPGAPAVIGINDNTGPGVRGVSSGSDGVSGTSLSSAHAGVAGTNDGGGMGVFGSGNPAGRFVGNVEVTGDIFLVNADCSEDFDIAGAEEVEPGTVMVIDYEGALQPSKQAYDKRVAGVISGAGDYKPGITLDKRELQDKRMPIALLGKAYCKVDAQYSPIDVGDLLTTSPTPGHAMKADNPLKAFGAVLGKALRPLDAGQGMIPILIALQ
jgi:hypothetical protein